MKNLTHMALLEYTHELKHEADNYEIMNNCCTINFPETNDIKRHINLVMANMIKVIVTAEASEFDCAKESIHE